MEASTPEPTPPPTPDQLQQAQARINDLEVRVRGANDELEAMARKAFQASECLENVLNFLRESGTGIPFSIAEELLQVRRDLAWMQSGDTRIRLKPPGSLARGTASPER